MILYVKPVNFSCYFLGDNYLNKMILKWKNWPYKRGSSDFYLTCAAND